MDYIQIALQIRELLENLIDLLDIHIINACRRKCNVRFFQIIDFRIVQNVQKRGRNTHFLCTADRQNAARRSGRREMCGSVRGSPVGQIPHRVRDRHGGAADDDRRFKYGVPDLSLIHISEPTRPY